MKTIILLGHSLGGDLTTIMAKDNIKGNIEKYISVEGDLTQHDLFISGSAKDENDKNRFPEWFENEFKNKIIYEGYGIKHPSIRRYYASLNMCDPMAFLQNSIELVEKNTTNVKKEFKSEIGEIYKEIRIPNLYCYAKGSLNEKTVDFIHRNNINNQEFNESTHWLMIDETQKFNKIIYEFIFNK